MKHFSSRSFWFGLVLGMLITLAPDVHATPATSLEHVATLSFQQTQQDATQSKGTTASKEIAPEKTPLKAIFQNMLDWLYAPDEKVDETPKKDSKDSKN